MALEMDPFTFLSCDRQLSWWSLLSFLSLLGFRADSCTREEGGGEEGWKAFPCMGAKPPVSVRRHWWGGLELEGMWLRLGGGARAGVSG